MEHHANIIPWQIISKFTKSIIRYASIDNYGNLNIKDFKNLLNNKTKIVAITQASNVLGTINPIKNICMWAHEVGSVVVVDAAQSIVHNKIDVQKLDCDFLVFSGHKIYGPTGIGVLYSKRKYLENMVPYKTGGNMINEVTKEKTIYADIPAKFEAGTPNIAGVIGLDSAIKYFNSLNYKLMKLYEKELHKKICKKLKNIKDIKFLANPDKTIPICSFLIQNIHSNDISAIISNFGIALRSGHHCAMPLMQKLNTTSSIRVSLAFYNTKKEIDIFIDSLKKTIKLLT
uniref:Cysteine desulfurase SufS selenocysteine lyase n=1 Tax=Candidatus Endecteinascidia fromenterensis TaxID=266021 RepID=G8D476_9GAMM|nr:cysteine desulfurase SufS selenocysteine lyase [Candidatus Endoecteinascidia frumentensis]